MSESAKKTRTSQSVSVAQFAGLRTPAPLARFSLRGDLSQLATALASSGVPISRAACRAIQGERCATLGLGPDEQLLLAPLAQAASLREVLERSLATLAHSLVDISHRQLSFELVGTTAATLLNAGCPLDLDEAAFPVGMCTR